MKSSIDDLLNKALKNIVQSYLDGYEFRFLIKLSLSIISSGFHQNVSVISIAIEFLKAIFIKCIDYIINKSSM